MRAIFSASSPMRSRSVIILMTVTIMRRSCAAGWRRAMMCAQSSSICTSSAFTRWSLAIVCSASWRLPVESASMAAVIWVSTRPPICSTRERTVSSSAS